MPNAQALILNGHKQLCGVHEPGEIVLRTPFRTLGYINATAESRKRFVRNPFRDDADDLVYFTGDSGFYQPDGTLQILGRLDDEVKIRGVRIDPAEVTATLAKHPLVRACVVMGNRSEHGEPYLAAYVVAAGKQKPPISQLRSYLLEQLPSAMVPAFFVLLDALPLTPNGKIDRKALPEPDKQASLEQSHLAPRTETERMIAAIWSEVLKVPAVGAEDNFFDLGGHSLLATQIVSRIRAALQVNVALRALFEMPTVAALSRHLETIQRAGQDPSATLPDEADQPEETVL
jgi:acyl carrier protein